MNPPALEERKVEYMCGAAGNERRHGERKVAERAVRQGRSWRRVCGRHREVRGENSWFEGRR